MQPLRFPRAWLVAGLVLLVLGLAMALLPVPSAGPRLNDKLLHVAGFAAFMVWFAGVVERRHWAALALALAGYGLLIEILQGLTPSRRPEGLDLVADVTGILLGWLLGTAGLSRWCHFLESWLVPRKH